jgi:hypothetical protein
MTPMSTLKLPDPVAAYFEADQQKDADAVAHCFTAEATVKDEGRTHHGVAAIRAWKIESSARYSYMSEPTAVEQSGRACVVTSRLTGNFPGSPVYLRFTFRLEGGRIASLEIAP